MSGMAARCPSRAESRVPRPSVFRFEASLDVRHAASASAPHGLPNVCSVEGLRVSLSYQEQGGATLLDLRRDISALLECEALVAELARVLPEQGTVRVQGHGLAEVRISVGSESNAAPVSVRWERGQLRLDSPDLAHAWLRPLEALLAERRVEAFVQALADTLDSRLAVARALEGCAVPVELAADAPITPYSWMLRAQLHPGAPPATGKPAAAEVLFRVRVDHEKGGIDFAVPHLRDPSKAATALSVVAGPLGPDSGFAVAREGRSGLRFRLGRGAIPSISGAINACLLP